MKKIILLIVLSLQVIILQAQNASLSGQLVDSKNMALFGAHIVVLQPLDSSIVKGASSNFEGNFNIQNIPSGNLIIKISYLGFDNLFLFKMFTDNAVSLGKITLKEKSTSLNEIKVVGIVAPVKQLNDTSQFNAGSFKTNPDANAEDLVTKMPGIAMNNGKLQAQGEDVQKVLVDGREFFGDDANAVLKNLPAEAIDKIQVFDKKSDQSVLTGFDDGNTSKTINVVTKLQFRNGVFGKAYAGYGYEDKWKSGLNLNFFKDKRRISILSNTNNINEQNFSSEDLLGVMSSGGGNSGRRGGGRRGGGQGSDASNFLVDQSNGITTTNSFGINYVNQWNKVDFTGSYFVNNSKNNSLSDLFRQFITKQNEGLTYSENQQNESNNTNHRVNFKIQWKPDSANTVILQPKISVQLNDGSTNIVGKNEQNAILLSDTKNDFNSKLTGINISAPLNIRHSFAKRGRSLSLNATPGFNQNSGNSSLVSVSRFYTDTLTANDLNQVTNLNVQGVTFNSNLAYTETITKSAQLMFNYGINYTNSNSNRETYNVIDSSNETNLNPSLSNNFKNKYFSQNLGLTYRYQQKKWNISTGLSYQYAQLHNEQEYPTNFNLDRTFNNLLPNGRFQYNFSTKKSLRLYYRSNNTAPSVSQLQSVINNQNPLQLSTGNPDLKQNWQNNITIRYSSVNTEKTQSFFALLSGAFTRNYISNSTFIASNDTTIAPGVILTKGSQIVSPVNLDGYRSIRTYNNYSFPIKKIKSNLNLSLGGTATKTPGMVNNQVNYANSYNVGFGVSLSSNISKDVDFMISSNTNYSNISNTLQSNLNSNYLNQNTKFKIQVMPWKGLVFQTDLSHQYNMGLSQNFNQNYLLLNAAIGYKFLKDRKGELRLNVFDILKQNNSVSRNTTETYYEDVRSNVLQRYAMLTFTYNIKYFKQSETKRKANFK